jgi:hypothetical protein
MESGEVNALLAITPYWGDRALAFLVALGVIWGLIQGRRGQER